MADNRDLLTYLDRLKTARVLCIGDVMLDHSVSGEVERVSSEAAVPVLTVEHETKSLGGAGNILRNLGALGAAASFISVVGDDESGREIKRLLAAQDNAELHVLVQPQRMTTVKTRYIGGNRPLLRADREAVIPLDPHVRDDLLRLAHELVGDHAVAIVSDYAKGVLTDGVALEIIRAAAEAGARVIVDPKGGDPIRYRGADLMRVSRRELARVTGMPVGREADVIAAGHALIDRCALGAVLISLGGDGMILVCAGGPVTIERSEAREVYDLLGAGDAVVATVAAGLAAGVPLTEAVRLANVAAGIVASKLGTALAFANEIAAALDGGEVEGNEKLLPHGRALALVEGWRSKGYRIGFTNGCFNMLHPGHVALLARAKAACDRLVVGLNSDASAARQTGAAPPVQPSSARAAVLASLAAVDLVILFDEETPLDLIRAIRPNLLVKGANHRPEEVVGADLVTSLGGEVLLAELTPGYGAAVQPARAAR